jgi:hypothetical protein
MKLDGLDFSTLILKNSICFHFNLAAELRKLEFNQWWSSMMFNLIKHVLSHQQYFSQYEKTLFNVWELEKIQSVIVISSSKFRRGFALFGEMYLAEIRRLRFFYFNSKKQTFAFIPNLLQNRGNWNLISACRWCSIWSNMCCLIDDTFRSMRKHFSLYENLRRHNRGSLMTFNLINDVFSYQRYLFSLNEKTQSLIKGNIIVDASRKHSVNKAAQACIANLLLKHSMVKTKN